MATRTFLASIPTQVRRGSIEAENPVEMENVLIAGMVSARVWRAVAATLLVCLLAAVPGEARRVTSEVV